MGVAWGLRQLHDLRPRVLHSVPATTYAPRLRAERLTRLRRSRGCRVGGERGREGGGEQKEIT